MQDNKEGRRLRRKAEGADGMVAVVTEARRQASVVQQVSP